MAEGLLPLLGRDSSDGLMVDPSFRDAINVLKPEFSKFASGWPRWLANADGGHSGGADLWSWFQSLWGAWR
jgi:hypothetical protein